MSFRNYCSGFGLINQYPSAHSHWLHPLAIAYGESEQWAVVSSGQQCLVDNVHSLLPTCYCPLATGHGRAGYNQLRTVFYVWDYV